MLKVNRWARASALGLCAAIYSSVPGCGSGSFSGCTQGQETCSCYGNKTCDAELVCLSNICVRPGAGGDTASGGSETATGGTGTSTGGAGSNRGGTGGTADGGADATGAGAGGEADSGGTSSSGGASTTGGSSAGKGGGTAAGGASAGKGGATNLGGRAQGGAASGGRAAGSGGSAEGGSDSGGAGNTPTVLILLDTSSSMFEAPLNAETSWAITHEALMATPGGVLAAYGDRVRFGFSSFKGNPVKTAETNPACATMTTVAFGANSSAIGSVYDTLTSQWTGDEKWETPTGHALRRATDLLLSDGDSGPKYILLITDGNPNTCTTLDPQCGQDRSVSATQDAFRAGIKTYPVGVGDIIAQVGTIQSGCTTGMARCGLDHLTDLANAGQGLPVVQPPPDYVYSACVEYETTTYLATYSTTGGAAMPGSGATVQELNGALHDALDAILADAH